MINYEQFGLTKEEAIEIMARRNTVMLKPEWFATFEKIGGESTLRILRAIDELYSNMEVVEIEDTQASIVFSMMLPALEAFVTKYLSRSVTASEKANKRWGNRVEDKEDATACNGIQADAVDAHTHTHTQTHNHYHDSPSLIGVNSVSLSADEPLKEFDEVFKSSPSKACQQLEEFDYGILGSMVGKLYSSSINEDLKVWSEDEFKNVLVFYVQAFKHYMGVDHSKLTKENLEKIMTNLPWITDHHGDEHALDSKDYTDNYGLIDRYFETENLSRSNRNINHFMSGDIRTNLFFSKQNDEEYDN